MLAFKLASFPGSPQQTALKALPLYQHQSVLRTERAVARKKTIDHILSTDEHVTLSSLAGTVLSFAESHLSAVEIRNCERNGVCVRRL